MSFSWAGKGDVVPPGYPPLQGKGTFWATAALALMRVVLSLAVPQVASTLHTPAWPGTPPGTEAGGGGGGQEGGAAPWGRGVGSRNAFPSPRINAVVSLWPRSRCDSPAGSAAEPRGCSTAGPDPAPWGRCWPAYNQGQAWLLSPRVKIPPPVAPSPPSPVLGFGFAAVGSARQSVGACPVVSGCPRGVPGVLQPPGELGQGLQDERRKKAGGVLGHRVVQTFPPRAPASAPVPATANLSSGCSWHPPSTPCPWAFPRGKAARGPSEKQQPVQRDHEPLGTSLPLPSLLSQGQVTLWHPRMG